MAELAQLIIEEKPNEQMHFVLKGNPVTVAKMISTVMRHKQDIAAAMIASVVEYCHEEGFDCGDLEHMVKFK